MVQGVPNWKGFRVFTLYVKSTFFCDSHSQHFNGNGHVTSRDFYEIMREHSLHVQSGGGGLGLLFVPGGVTCDIIQKSPPYVDSLVAFVAEQVVAVVALTAR